MTFVDDKVVITGVGQSAVGRKLFRSGIDLAIDAALEAIAHAGLQVEDIDGDGGPVGDGITRPLDHQVERGVELPGPHDR